MRNHPPTIDAVLARVQAWIDQLPRGGKRQLCLDAGLAPNTLGRVEAPDWAPSLDTLRRIERQIPPTFRAPG